MIARTVFGGSTGHAFGHDLGSDAVIGTDLAIVGTVRNARILEVWGRIDGEVQAEHLLVHQGGHVQGTVKADSAEVHGVLEGHITIRNLIAIADTGQVTGNVRYGRLTLAEGGDLQADVRNVPPELGGDFELTVRRNGHARVTTADITAYDPDDASSGLTYEVSAPAGGHIARRTTPDVPIYAFTQADIEAGDVIFQHDGAAAGSAHFAVTVSDASGASSGAPRIVSVAVLG